MREEGCPSGGFIYDKATGNKVAAVESIPVIILSGSIDAKGQERVRTLGAEALLSKPLVPEQLFEALTKAL